MHLVRMYVCMYVCMYVQGFVVTAVIRVFEIDLRLNVVCSLFETPSIYL